MTHSHEHPAFYVYVCACVCVCLWSVCNGISRVGSSNMTTHSTVIQWFFAATYRLSKEPSSNKKKKKPLLFRAQYAQWHLSILIYFPHPYVQYLGQNNNADLN